MFTRSNPLLLVFCSAVLLSCGGSGGSQYDDVCASYTDSILDCLQFNTSDARTISRAECVDQLEESQELDGDVCVSWQIATFECIEADPTDSAQCDDLFTYLDLKWNDLFRLNPPALRGQPTAPLPFCDTEIRESVDECPQSISLPNDPTDPT